VHWGKVLVVGGSECTIKKQTDEKPISHSITDMFLAEAAAWAAFDSIPSADMATLYPETDHEATDQKILRRSAQLSSETFRRTFRHT